MDERVVEEHFRLRVPLGLVQRERRVQCSSQGRVTLVMQAIAIVSTLLDLTITAFTVSLIYLTPPKAAITSIWKLHHERSPYSDFKQATPIPLSRENSRVRSPHTKSCTRRTWANMVRLFKTGPRPLSSATDREEAHIQSAQCSLCPYISS